MRATPRERGGKNVSPFEHLVRKDPVNPNFPFSLIGKKHQIDYWKISIK